MKRIAIIDVGSNSARLVIMEVHTFQASNLIYNQKDPLRLALKTDRNGYLTEEAFSATITCLKNFASMCRVFHVDETIAVATAAIRNAPNGLKLAKAASEASGISLEIISGKTEAFLSYLGVINTIPVKDALVFDLGGASTEVILVKDRKLVDSISLPIGCVNLTKNFKLNNTADPAALNKMRRAIAEQMEKAPWLAGCGLPLVGVGGTARSVGKIEQKRVKYFSSKLHNYQYPIQDFKEWYKTLPNTTLAMRRRIPGLSSDRADVIIAGSTIIKALADRSKARKLVISGCGLREGLFSEYLHHNTDRALVDPDILETSRENLLHLYAQDEDHCRQVARFATKLFTGWQSLHQLEPAKWQPLLETAALLHDIGIAINYYNHTRHTGYLIENGRLFGLDHMDVVYTAIMAAWHHGINRGYLRNKPYRKYIPEVDIKRLSTGALLLALAECLDYTQTSAISEIETSIVSGSAILTITAEQTPSVELHQQSFLSKWFRKSMGLPLTVVVKENGTASGEEQPPKAIPSDLSLLPADSSVEP
mgnify:FL=1